MSLRNWKYTPLLLMLIFPVLGKMYAWVNKPRGKVYHLMTSWDNAIPFVKYFALPYSVWIFYIYLCLFYFFKNDLRVYYRALLIYTVCACICYGIYSVVQTTVPRPELVGHDVFTLIVRFVYHRDQPFNCFPSIHVFSSYMVFRLTASSGFRNKWNMLLIGGMSGMIILSTLFIKQHAILDGLAGIMLVEIVLAAVLLVEHFFTRSSSTPQERSFEDSPRST
ncbi:phosphatase PAP2 family protein [Paenibacillus sp. BAC0078]